MARSYHKRRGPRSSSPFAMVHWMVMDSQGWHDLPLIARCAYVEMVRRCDPHFKKNNGTIAMPARYLAARLGVSKSAAAAALREIEDAGFITCMKLGTFTNRLASEYRVNMFRCNVTGDSPNRAWNNTPWRCPVEPIEPVEPAPSAVALRMRLYRQRKKAGASVTQRNARPTGRTYRSNVTRNAPPKASRTSTGADLRRNGRRNARPPGRTHIDSTMHGRDREQPHDE